MTYFLSDFAPSLLLQISLSSEIDFSLFVLIFISWIQHKCSMESKSDDWLYHSRCCAFQSMTQFLITSPYVSSRCLVIKRIIAVAQIFELKKGNVLSNVQNLARGHFPFYWMKITCYTWWKASPNLDDVIAELHSTGRMFYGANTVFPPSTNFERILSKVFDFGLMRPRHVSIVRLKLVLGLKNECLIRAYLCCFDSRGILVGVRE